MENQSKEAIGVIMPEGQTRLEYQAMLTSPFLSRLGSLGTIEKLVGRCYLIVTTEYLEICAMKVSFLNKPLGPKGEPYRIPWSQVRDLDNLIMTKGRFEANLGKDSDMMRNVRITEGDLDALNNILDSLPDTATHIRCPSCGGPAPDRKSPCPKCGKKPAWEYRKQGLIYLGGGIVSIILAILIALVIPGALKAWTMAAGLIGFPAILIGIVKLLSGRR